MSARSPLTVPRPQSDTSIARTGGIGARNWPAGWALRPLEDLVLKDSPICYGIVQPGPHKDDGVLVVAIRNLNAWQDEMHRASRDIERVYFRSRIAPNDVLISVKGTTGRIGLVPPNFHGNISRDIARLRLTSDQVPEFWLHMLRSYEAQQILEVAVVGTTRRELSIGILRQVVIACPPKEEQMAIASALSDVGALVDSLGSLIAKKRAIKFATMQKLLTGTKRLSGFDSEWEKLSLSEVCELEVGRRPKGGVTEEGDVPSLGGENIHNDNGLKLDIVNRVSHSFFAGMRRGILREFDVIINKDGANTGKVALFAGTGLEQACVNEHLFILRGRGRVDNRFLYGVLCLQSVRNEIKKHIASSAQPGLNQRFFRHITIPIPPLAEQQAIASVLTEMDAEIAVLERRREKVRSVKQGMMQALLTGRVRMFAPEVNT